MPSHASHAHAAVNGTSQHFAISHYQGPSAVAHSDSFRAGGHAPGRHHSTSFHAGGSQQITGLQLASASQLSQQHLNSQFLARHGVASSFAERHDSQHTDGSIIHGGSGSNLLHHHHHHNASSLALFFGGFFPFWGYGYGAGYGSGSAGYGGSMTGGNQPRYAYDMHGESRASRADGTSEATAASRWAAALPPIKELIGEFAARGEYDFKRGDYDAAVYNWRHAIMDDPANGTLVLMLAQALFALGNFDEAAGAVQQAIAMLPENQWGVVVGHNTELYPKVGVYAAQLRALEQAVREDRDSPGLRFLVGYHYGYLGHSRHGVTQLENATRLAPEDKLAKRLLDRFVAEARRTENQPAEKRSAPRISPRPNAGPDA